jgi:hypothetical protein
MMVVQDPDNHAETVAHRGSDRKRRAPEARGARSEAKPSEVRKNRSHAPEAGG